MNIGVRAVFNFAAARTFVTAIGGRAGNLDGIPAVQSFGQRAREKFQFFQLIFRKKIRVTETSARERTLEQLHALRLVGKIYEGHFALEKFREIIWLAASNKSFHA